MACRIAYCIVCGYTAISKIDKGGTIEKIIMKFLHDSTVPPMQWYFGLFYSKVLLKFFCKRLGAYW